MRTGKKKATCAFCKKTYIDYVGFDEERSSPVLLSRNGCPHCKKSNFVSLSETIDNKD